MLSLSPRGLLLIGAALVGCNDGPGFNYIRGDTLAVVVGDFDNVQEPFDRVPVATVRYDGIISSATWVVDERDYVAPSLDVETLFLSDRNDELRSHQLVVVASGSRGFGEREYNSLQADDHIVGNEEAVDNARAYVGGGGILWLTDWTYDLIPRAFPEAVTFLGDDEQLDAAQRGDIGSVQATVVDEELREALDSEQLSLSFNYSNWAVPEAVLDESNVRVLVRGDVTYRESSGGGTQTIADAPLMFAVRSGEQSGLLVYSAFHLDAQNPAVVDTMMTVIAGDLELSTSFRDPGVDE